VGNEQDDHVEMGRWISSGERRCPCRRDRSGAYQKEVANMSLVVAGIYVAVLFGVGMSFVYRHRAVGEPKNGDAQNLAVEHTSTVFPPPHTLSSKK
jgi:hypothetical protein